MVQNTQPQTNMNKKKRSGKRGVFIFLGITVSSLALMIIGGKVGSEALVGVGLIGLLGGIVSAIVVFNPGF